MRDIISEISTRIEMLQETERLYLAIPLQEIGRELGMPMGMSIGENILRYIRQLKETSNAGS